MQLEKNMYVRTIGGIERLKKENDNGWFFEKSMIIKPDNIEKYIIKASHNIIDLIEVGDYVDGVEIVEIDNDPFIKGQINLWTNIRNTNGFGDIEIIKIIDKDIRTIVTKEQFESMSYKVGE